MVSCVPIYSEAFDVLREGKPLGGSWGGGWGTQPGLFSAARSEMLLCLFLDLFTVPQPKLELSLLLFLRSPPPRHLPKPTP